MLWHQQSKQPTSLLTHAILGLDQEHGHSGWYQGHHHFKSASRLNPCMNSTTCMQIPVCVRLANKGRCSTSYSTAAVCGQGALLQQRPTPLVSCPATSSPWGIADAGGRGRMPVQPFSYTAFPAWDDPRDPIDDDRSIPFTATTTYGFCTNLTLTAISRKLPAPTSLPVNPAHAIVAKQIQAAVANPPSTELSDGLYIASLPLMLTKWPGSKAFKASPKDKPVEFGSGFIG